MTDTITLDGYTYPISELMPDIQNELCIPASRIEDAVWKAYLNARARSEFGPAAQMNTYALAMSTPDGRTRGYRVSVQNRKNGAISTLFAFKDSTELREAVQAVNNYHQQKEG